MTEQNARKAMERWPNYTEQSWSERFAELDKAFKHQQSIIDGLVRQITTQAAKLAEKDAEIARLRGALDNIRALATKHLNACGPNGTIADIQGFALAALKPERTHDAGR